MSSFLLCNHIVGVVKYRYGQFTGNILNSIKHFFQHKRYLVGKINLAALFAFITRNIFDYHNVVALLFDVFRCGLFDTAAAKCASHCCCSFLVL